MEETRPEGPGGGPGVVVLLLAWTAVGIPMLWGIFMTIRKASLLFK
ncbi:MAG TPA: hypothetical protein PKA50_05060 [Gemmatimonadales bacterium]|nr:hypothetical protein [Gemmatimonadales bacterium]